MNSYNASPTVNPRLPLWQVQAKARLELRRREAGQLARWPAAYTHAKSDKTYQPPNAQVAAFIANDRPRYQLLKGGEGGGKSAAGIVKTLDRIRRGESGAMCCVSGDTMVDGIPIAERNDYGLVDTLRGPQMATPSFCEGKADLFRVVTQSGAKVSVTEGHRFLTPIGWRQLRDLRIGDLIAVDDTSYAQNLNEKWPNSQGYYSWDFRLYDEYANLSELHNQDKWLLLAWLAQDFVRGGDHLDRVYIDRSFCPPSWAGGDGEDSVNSNGGKEFPNLPDASFLSALWASPLDNPQSFDQYLIDWIEDNADQKVGDDLYFSQSLKLAPESIQLSVRSLQDISLHHKEQVFDRDRISLECLFLPYRYYTPTFTKIQKVAFQEYGEFYDLTVPFAGHYGAEGLLHHNSPDLEHFKKSLWPAFKEWCPWEAVIERQRYRKQEGWQPTSAFVMVFHNEVGGYSELLCGGAKETEIGSWEGPNLGFLHFDEARRHKTPVALKTFDGRVRIPGPNGEPPQIYLTTTPRKHWLFEYFAGAAGDEKSLPLVPEEIQRRYADFKADAFVATVLTEENRANLSEGFIEQRRQTLDAAEARVLLAAEWEDESDIEKFVNIIWWDNCKDTYPGLGYNEPCIISLDAAKGGETNVPDCFSMMVVTRHPERPNDVAVRYSGIWQPQPGQLLDFAPIEQELRRLCATYAVLEVAYDPYQLHDMAMRLKSEGVANFKEFKQGIDRLKADKQLQDLIMGRRIAHDGNPLLRQHIDNANIKKGGQDGIRLVKRSTSLKIDAAVSLSMAANRILYYNV